MFAFSAFRKTCSRLVLLGLLAGVVLVLAACAPPPQVITPTLERGVALIQEGHCGACHVIPGVPNATGEVGPNLCETATRYRRGEIDLDDVMTDIAQPNRRVHEGYLDNIMPTDYTQRFTQEDLQALAEFIVALDCLAPPPTATFTPGGGG